MSRKRRGIIGVLGSIAMAVSLSYNVHNVTVQKTYNSTVDRITTQRDSARAVASMKAYPSPQTVVLSVHASTDTVIIEHIVTETDTITLVDIMLQPPDTVQVINTVTLLDTVYAVKRKDGWIHIPLTQTKVFPKP